MAQKRSDDAAVLLYDRFVATSRTAIDAGLFEAAFHGLSAAMHCAEVLEDITSVQEIERIADRTQRQIDRQEPGHRIGSKSAADRGQHALFATLTVHAQSIAARIRAASAVARAEDASRPENHRGGRASDTREK